MNHNKGQLYGIFIFTLITGFFFGIEIETGVVINPETIALEASDDIIREMVENNPQQNEVIGIWNFFKAIISINGLIGLIEFVASLYIGGPFALIVAIFGYFGGLLLINSSNIGIWLIIIGAILAQLGDNFN